MATQQRKIHVFVHLAHGFGARRWTKRWAKGDIPGLNEKLPYGYYRAANKTCIVEYSEDADENRLVELLRLSMRRLLGCDLLHAWRNRKALFEADVVWTHTELEHLAVLALWQCLRRECRPKLIAQSVWLFDRWRQLLAPRRWLYRRLLTDADVLTVHSPENLKVVREVFPRVRSELIRFGINSDTIVPPVQQAAHSPVRIVALGNDMHRDWETLIAVAEQWKGCQIRIASRRLDRSVASRAHNVDVIAVKSERDVAELYSWADIAAVSLKANLHASGITVIYEAMLRGVPVVCTDTGGLRAYFSEQEVRYVPPQDSSTLGRAFKELAKDDQMRFTMAKRAQARMLSADLSSRAFANRHYEISRQLLDLPA